MCYITKDIYGGKVPRKVVYTKDLIVSYAFDLVREEGIDSLTARNLAKRMKSSSQPIFSYFKSMEDVKEEVVLKARDKYNFYISQGLKYSYPFKGVGLMYVQFARDEKKLFSLLFMGPSEKTSHYLPSYDDNSHKIEEVLVKKYGMNIDSAKAIYNHLSVFVHGLGCLFAMGSEVFTIEDVDRMLSEEYQSLTNYFKEVKK